MTQHQADAQAPFTHDGPQKLPSGPDPIRIYMACLAAYNNGHLHGQWIEVTDEDTIWQAVQNMLAEPF